MVSRTDGHPDRAGGVWAALDRVKDPEMPGVSIVALGMVEAVREEAGQVEVTLIPTFVGCPALEIIRQDACRQVARALGLATEQVRVNFSSTVSWTTARVSPSCYPALLGRGIAPPPSDPDQLLTRTETVPCPWCGSEDTVVEGLFGPTACRSLHYCRHCRNPFEAIKPV